MAVTKQTTDQLAQAYGDAWNRHDPDAIAALHTEDAVFHNHTSGGRVVGPQAIRDMAASVFRTFPDLRFEVRRLYVRDDLIVQEWTAEGTHRGPITRDERVIAPTGKRIRWDGVDIMPVRDGRIARKDVYADSVGFLRQIEG